MRITIRGAVQGVGFRPFVYRLASDLGLTGWVCNSSHGVLIEVEADKERLKTFLLQVEADKPPLASIQSLEFSYLDPLGYPGFEIRDSLPGERTAIILPDVATCSACRDEIFDPADRRFRYPFTNCTNCGPRFSIIEALPYDRPNTTMRKFKMCDACQAEYEDPANRRFHAQPNACPSCGPHLELWDGAGRAGASNDDALAQATAAIKRGRIVAVKGLGGFHLLVDARDGEAVQRLRRRKGREEKPFALMYPGLPAIQSDCEVGSLEARLLRSAEAPIVLLKRKDSDAVAVCPAVAPDNPCLGIMLPYTPLHHLLMAELGFPVVATSGNFSEEPICTDEREALVRLRGIADMFLVHNRPIARHVDDSIARVLLDRELVLRRARGYAPLPIQLRKPAPAVLAVGGHLKNTVAISVGSNVFLSQHIGDLDTAQAFEAFRRVIASFQDLYNIRPEIVACDAHPEYRSTEFARSLGLPLVTVQHHYAHILSCMAENELEPPVLGVAWDGTGYGDDGTIWGGEFLQVTHDAWRRVGHLRTFRLPGGDAAAKEPRRAALAVMHETFGGESRELPSVPTTQAFSETERQVLCTMLERHVNAPITSSAGRLFDAVASLTGVRQVMRFEGQAAMAVEFSLPNNGSNEAYEFVIMERRTAENRSYYMVDWEPMVRGLLEDMRNRTAPAMISAKFHNGLTEAIVGVARRIGEERVVLSGGCFQNRYLTERTIQRLTAEGFRPYWHQRVPPNDGGIALGQICAAVRDREKERAPCA